MNTKDAIIEIIEINKVIKYKGMHLLSTLSEVKGAPYSSLIKPLRKKFELTEMGDRYLAFKGVSDGAHRSLSYQRSEGDIFYIHIETNVGEKIEIILSPIHNSF